MQSKLDADKAWWESKRAAIQSDFMKELDGDGKPADAAPRPGSSDDDAVLVNAGGPGEAQGVQKRKGKK